MAYNSRFNFKGDVIIPKGSSQMKRPLVKEFRGGKNGDTDMIVLNFGIKANNSTGYVGLFGMDTENTYVNDINNESIVVKREDRLNPDVVESVAPYQKIIVELYGKESRQEFISGYDAAVYLAEQLPEYRGKLRVIGDFSKKPGNNGGLFDTYDIKHVYGCDENDETPDQLLLTLDLFYNADSVDKSDFKANKKIYVSAYINQYFRKADIGEEKGKRLFVNQDVVLSSEKYDLENEKHKKLLEYKLKYVDVKNTNMFHIPWECVLINGAEEVKFDETMLTDEQREQVELGIKQLKDFMPKDSKVFGERINEIRLRNPILVDEYSNGMIDSEYTMDEFEAEIFKPLSAKNEDLFVKENNDASQPTTKDADEIELDDSLF